MSNINVLVMEEITKQKITKQNIIKNIDKYKLAVYNEFKGQLPKKITFDQFKQHISVHAFKTYNFGNKPKLHVLELLDDGILHHHLISVEIEDDQNGTISRVGMDG